MTTGQAQLTPQLELRDWQKHDNKSDNAGGVWRSNEHLRGSLAPRQIAFKPF